jgi:type II protein arginine methyltransferase
MAVLDVSMWRQTDGRKVWYEWMIEGWGLNMIRLNSKRRGADETNQDDNESFSMVPLGKTELHSSIKNACLM